MRSLSLLDTPFCHQVRQYRPSLFRFGLSTPLLKTDSVTIDFMVSLVKGAGKNMLVNAGFLKDIPEGKDFELINCTRPDSALAKVALKTRRYHRYYPHPPPLGS